MDNSNFNSNNIFNFNSNSNSNSNSALPKPVLYISSTHCKFSEKLVQRLILEKVNIIDIVKIKAPSYITEVPTLTYEGQMYVGYKNTMDMFSKHLYFCLKPVKNEIATYKAGIQSASLGDTTLGTPLFSSDLSKPTFKEGFGELLPSQLRVKKSKLIKNSGKRDLKSSFDQMMAQRNKLSVNIKKHG